MTVRIEAKPSSHIEISAAENGPGDAVLASAKSPELLQATTAVETTPKTKTVRMLVTAYCACKKCCGPSAHGLTASGKSITFNNGRFVAADTARLPFGTRLSIPGYCDGESVQVIDRGAAIKGNHVDVYFSSHETAVKWGKRVLDVTIAAP